MINDRQFFKCIAPTVFVSAETLATLPVFEGLYAIEDAFTPEQAAEREAERRQRNR